MSIKKTTEIKGTNYDIIEIRCGENTLKRIEIENWTSDIDVLKIVKNALGRLRFSTPAIYIVSGKMPAMVAMYITTKLMAKASAIAFFDIQAMRFVVCYSADKEYKVGQFLKPKDYQR